MNKNIGDDKQCTTNKADFGDMFGILKIPENLHDLMKFADVRFAAKDNVTPLMLSMWSIEKMRNPMNWTLVLPTNIPGKRIEIPINDPIDEKDPEGHWRAILAAAADFQALVNSGEHKPA